MSIAKKAAFAGVFVALMTVANSFLSIDISPSVKISFNYFLSFFCGVIFGPVIGFAICFLGDLLAFLMPVFGGGVYWLPTGICSGLLAFIPGLVFGIIDFDFRGGVFAKTAISVVCTYLFITCGLGALSNYYYVKFVINGGEYSKAFFVYLGGKILVSSIVSAINYALIFITIPIFNSISAIGFKIE